MKFLLFFLSLFISVGGKAQVRENLLRFQFTIEEQALELGRKYYLPANEDSIAFTKLKFYISDLQFFQDTQLISIFDQKYLLLDLENPGSLELALPSTAEHFNNIQFNIGIDSLTNVSGAFGGDLDPTNGMYWTWQSGYINVKLEGTADHCPARKQQFQFHLGGYQKPFDSLQTVSLESSESMDFTIKVAIDKLLTFIDLGEDYQIMSPNEKAVEMARVFASVFSFRR